MEHGRVDGRGWESRGRGQDGRAKEQPEVRRRNRHCTGWGRNGNLLAEGQMIRLLMSMEEEEGRRGRHETRPVE